MLKSYLIPHLLICFAVSSEVGGEICIELLDGVLFNYLVLPAIMTPQSVEDLVHS